MDWKKVATADVQLPGLVASLPSQKGKVVVISGTTSGTGFVAAGVAAGLGAHVVLLNRLSARSKASLEKLQRERGEANFTDVACDLQDFASVRAAAATISKHFADVGIDVLINNAGVMALPDTRTKDGFEIQMQTNHLSSFLLVKELLPLLEKASGRTGQARIVNHSSGAAKGPPLEVLLPPLAAALPLLAATLTNNTYSSVLTRTPPKQGEVLREECGGCARWLHGSDHELHRPAVAPLPPEQISQHLLHQCAGGPSRQARQQDHRHGRPPRFGCH